MHNYDLGFISNENIFSHVKNTVDKYRFHIDLKKFNGNLIDPIKLTFDSKIYKKAMNEVVEAEVIRQIDKSNTNHIGYFHQNIFRFFGKGWTVPTTGWDVENITKKIYVEMKNKHNTMNSSSSKSTFLKMQNEVLKNPEATCMLVEVIANNSQNIMWRTSVDGTSLSHPNIRRVSIDKFYELATNDKFAFRKLCEKLPKIIDDVVNDTKFNPGINTVGEELKKIDPNIIKSLYLLSFNKYEGFDTFNL
jgi:hypothetical protein